MREITIATVQMKPELGQPENNLVKMSDYISTIASQQEVDLIVFPELVTTGYELGLQFTELAQRVPGPAVNLMAQRAADLGVYLAFGLATKEKVESVLYNTAVLLGPDGELLGQYHKVHLRGEERMAFREGFKLPIFETDEIGKVGLMIGWDLAFPEVARALALEGAEIICALGNWETSYIDEWKTYVRARAYENAVFMAAANRVGEDITMVFGGESMIVGPRGKLHAYLEIGEGDFKNQLEADIKKALEQSVEAKKLDAAQAEKKKDEEAERKAEAAKREPDSAAAKEEQKAEEQLKDALKKLEQAEDKKADDNKADNKKDAKSADDKADKKDDLKAIKDVKEADQSKVIALQAPMIPEMKAEFKKTTATEGFCVARIDLDEVRRYREEFQTLQTRQPTAYKRIVKRY